MTLSLSLCGTVCLVDTDNHVLLACRYIEMPASDPFSVVYPNTNTFAACVARCNADPCEFVTYDYVSKNCTVREGRAPVYVG